MFETEEKKRSTKSFCMIFKCELLFVLSMWAFELIYSGGGNDMKVWSLKKVWRAMMIKLKYDVFILIDRFLKLSRSKHLIKYKLFKGVSFWVTYVLTQFFERFTMQKDKSKNLWLLKATKLRKNYNSEEQKS